VSEPESVLLGRAELERAFTALGERLTRRGIVADVFVVGGAAMALAYHARKMQASAAYSIIPDYASWPPRRVTFSR
jgi:hypothetical protein